MLLRIRDGLTEGTSRLAERGFQHVGSSRNGLFRLNRIESIGQNTLSFGRSRTFDGTANLLSG
jgi:hypothetical protein